MNNKGFSIIELLIAMAIGTVILLSIMTLFQKNDKTYKTQNVSAEAGQNVRTAMDMIVRELKMAGFGLPAITTPITVAYNAGITNVFVGSTQGIVSGDKIFVCGSNGKCESGTVVTINPISVALGASLRIDYAFVNNYVVGDKLFSIEDSQTGLELEKILSSSPYSTSGTYSTKYGNNFQYVKDATKNSISFIAGIDKIMTTLTASYTSGGTSITVSSSSSFKNANLIIVTSGGEFESTVVNGNPSSPYTTMNITPALTKAYSVGSAVYKVDVITYNFNSASKTLERGLNGGALQDVAQNIEYFRFKYYDVNRTLIPYTGVGNSLIANERAAVRNINVQAVAITDKEDPTHNNSAGTYDDGTTIPTDHKYRFFLESDVYLRNTIP